MRLTFLFFLVSAPSCFAQLARDYFFPKESNLSIYKMVNPQNGSATKVYFKYAGDSATIVTQSDLAMARNDNVIKSNQVWEQSVEIRDSEILGLRMKIPTSTGVETFDRSGEIIFKIPKGKNEKEEWENEDQKGTIIETHVSEFSKIKVNGERKKAVKVTTMLKRRRNGKKEKFYIDYYVEGIGRYKRTPPNSNVAIEVLAEQSIDNNPPEVK